MKRRRSLRPMSKNRRAENRRRREMAAELGNAPCGLKTPACFGSADDWHELVGAAHGGSRVDRRNIVPACRPCNTWVEDNPSLARRYGWKVPPWDAVEGEDGLIPAASSLWGGPDWTTDGEGEPLEPWEVSNDPLSVLRRQVQSDGSGGDAA